MPSCVSRRPRAALAAAALAVPLLLVGCSDDALDAEAAPTVEDTPTATSTSPGTDPSTPSVSASTSPSGSPTPTQDPTPEGTVVEMDGGTFVLPEGYRVQTEGRLLTVANRTKGKNLDLLSLTTQSNLGVIDPLPEAVKNHNAGQIAYLYEPTTLDPVTVDGTELFHVAGKVNDAQWGEAFGGDTDDFLVDISFLFDLRVPAAERNAIVQDFLAGIDLNP